MAARIALDRDQVAEFCRKHHIRRLALFGSVLRDDFRPESDVDVLVEFEPGREPGYLRLYRIEQELSGILDRRAVDVVTYRSLNHRLRDLVVAASEVQYAQK